MLYEQSSLDGLAVAAKGSALDFIVHQHPDTATASLDRDAVLRLHAALGEWLYPVHTPEWANKSLIEQMIERAVKDQVAAVLPLHLKPGDRLLVADADGRVSADLESHGPGEARAATLKLTRGLCISENCTLYDGADHAVHELDDPEPHDVGHAEEPEGVHRPQDCPGAGACPEASPEPDPLFAPGARAYYRKALGLEPEPTDHGRLMSELPVRTRPRNTLCAHCGHGWGEHTAGVCWGTSQTPEGAGCTCTRQRPNSPASNPWDCTGCGHPNSVHVPATGECLECACRPGGGE